MGREVALAFPEALDCFERADRVLADRYDRPLSRFIFPPPSFTPEQPQSRQAELTETNVAQPALGATDLAYLHVLRALGVEPQMVAGHSYGELVALCAAGSARRGRSAADVGGPWPPDARGGLRRGRRHGRR